MKFTNISQLAGILISTLLVSVHSHSWIDSLQVVGGINPNAINIINPSNITLAMLPGQAPSPKLGYIRGYPDVRVDTVLTHRIMFLENAPACMDTQKTRSQQNPNKPMLVVAPGSLVQGKYTENGHISLPNSPKQKPGTIYWFGTKKPKNDEKLTDVLQWTEDSKGGDGRGKLLAKPSNFDDGICIEDNATAISKLRKDSGGGGSCKSTFKVPEDLEDGDIYTVYWAWDFSEHFGPVAPGKPREWYTSCMDLQVRSSTSGRGKVTRRGKSRAMRYRV